MSTGRKRLIPFQVYRNAVEVRAKAIERCVIIFNTNRKDTRRTAYKFLACDAF